MDAGNRDDSQASLAKRKVTKEALFSNREQKRAKCVRKCRDVAESLTQDIVINHMDHLLKDKVSLINDLFSLIRIIF
jgi:hypothetical protein